MTKDQGEDTGKPSGDWKYDARLSSGNTTQDGRLDLFYQGKWRAICTNYQKQVQEQIAPKTLDQTCPRQEAGVTHTNQQACPALP